MPNRTDRGYAVLTKETDGTTSVVVCADTTNGRPSHPYAVHSHHAAVTVDDTIRLAKHGATRYTTRPVEVVAADDGTVQVNALPDPARVVQAVQSRTSIAASVFGAAR